MLRSDYVPLRRPVAMGGIQPLAQPVQRPSARPSPPYTDWTEPPLTGEYDPSWGKVNPPAPRITDLPDYSRPSPQSAAANEATAAMIAKVLARRKALMKMYTAVVPRHFGSDLTSSGEYYTSGWGEGPDSIPWFDNTTNQLIGYSDSTGPTPQRYRSPFHPETNAPGYDTGSTYLDIHRVKPHLLQMNRFVR